jgi:hypothetical protein
MFEERITPQGRLSILLLLLLLSAQFAIFSGGRWIGRTGDEPYYMTRAKQLLDKAELPKVEGSGDWRPAGYSVFLAFFRGITRNWVSARMLCSFTQFTLLSLILLTFQTIACLFLKHSRAVFLTAILLGVQPWIFEDCRNLVPDSLTASLTTIGLLGLFASKYVKEKSHIIIFFLSALVLCTTIFLRPEMIAMAPLLICIGLFFQKQENPIFVRNVTIGLLILFILVGLQVLYRGSSNGKWEIYGNFSIKKRGAHSWTDSWFSTEQTAYTEFLHENKIFYITVDNFPKRAFADPWEKNTIREALARVQEQRTYDESADLLFQRVAEKRVRDNYFLNSGLTRLWRTLMMWFYFDGENLLSKNINQPVLKSTIIVGFYLFKMLIFGLAACSAVFTIRAIRNGTFAWYQHLTGLMIMCVIVRTFLMGLVLGWMIHRYALVAWPAMLWCAVSAIITIRNQEYLLKPILRKKEI